MKKIITVAILFVLLFELSLFSNAKSIEYRINKYDITVSIPDEYSVITRDTPSSDPVFQALGTSKSAVNSYFEKSNIYLNAIIPETGEEIVFSITNNSLSSFSDLGETALAALVPTIKKPYIDSGLDIYKDTIYKNDQAAFIVFYVFYSSQSMYGLQYYTIVNKNAVSVTLHSYERINRNHEKLLLNVIDSMNFGIDSLTESDNEPVYDVSESFKYSDNEAGVEFIVPGTWQKTDLTKTRQFIDVKFASKKDKGLCFMFGASDLWNMMSMSEKKGLSRSDISDSWASKEIIKELIEVAESDSTSISEKNYNGVHYYIFEVVSKAEEYGVEFEIQTTHIIHIHNGWVYWFQFGGKRSNALYSEFEEVLNSVSYKNASKDDVKVDTPKSGTSNNQNTEGSSKNTVNSKTSIVVGLVISGAIIAIAIIFVIRSVLKKKEKQSIIEMPNEARTLFCRKCGAQLPEGDVFCHKCGTRIIF